MDDAVDGRGGGHRILEGLVPHIENTRLLVFSTLRRSQRSASRPNEAYTIVKNASWASDAWMASFAPGRAWFVSGSYGVLAEAGLRASAWTDMRRAMARA